MISWTINAAIQADCFDEIYVSTDDDEIAAVASLDGATPLIRPDSLAGDDASVTQVLVDYLQQQDSMPETVVVLYATAPMRTAEDIHSTMSLLDDGSCDYAMAATHFSHYVHQALEVDGAQFVKPRWPELYEMRPAEIGPLVAGNGSTYCVRVDTFMNSGSFIGEKTRVHVMPMIRSIDIDTIDDFHMAESIHRLQNSLG